MAQMGRGGPAEPPDFQDRRARERNDRSGDRDEDRPHPPMGDPRHEQDARQKEQHFVPTCRADADQQPGGDGTSRHGTANRARVRCGGTCHCQRVFRPADGIEPERSAEADRDEHGHFEPLGRHPHRGVKHDCASQDRERDEAAQAGHTNRDRLNHRRCRRKDGLCRGADRHHERWTYREELAGRVEALGRVADSREVKRWSASARACTGT